MALITVTGGRKGQRELVQSVAYFCAYRLMHKRMADNICVEIDLTDFGNDKNSGYCTWQYDYVKPRDFHIEISRAVDDDELIETVCHEMVHVKQYAKEEIKERFRPTHTEVGQGVDWHGKNYSDLPWEKEAYELQEQLVKEYICGR